MPSPDPTPTPKSSHSRPLLRRLLSPLGPLYQLVMRVRRWAYRQGWMTTAPLGLPVISVGNIRVGGTGKTPIVDVVVGLALMQGRRPAILARGYRSGLSSTEAGYFLGGRFTPLTPLSHSHPIAADEARLHSARHPQVPVIIGAQRGRAFRLFRTHSSKKGSENDQLSVDLVVLEDGGQHLAIPRDLDLMLVDWQTTADSIRPLPGGDYREGVAALTEASALILTRCPSNPGQPPGHELWQRLGKPIYWAEFRTGRPYHLGGGDSEEAPPALHLLTGIAEPERLHRQLVAAGLPIRATSFYGDHERLPIEGLTPLAGASESGDSSSAGPSAAGNVGWLITEKDLYRQQDSFTRCGHPVWVVPLEVVMTEADGATPLEDLIRSVYR